jgi:hypothetical protein
MKNHLMFPAAIAAIILGVTACKKAAVSEASNPSPVVTKPTTPEAKPAVATARPAAADTTTNVSRTVLVFRDIPSWNRPIDFEDVLTDLGFNFEVKPSSEMEKADLASYLFVIIPGAQWQTEFYSDYASNAARIDAYVKNGGTLLLELNGAERGGIKLPSGARMVQHGAIDNVITIPDHPILVPLAGRPIHANFASHGYLTDLPKDARILAAEMEGGRAVMEKPTFVEYAFGKGRVIAACQCFHDRDGSGRGPLMQTAISYAAEKEWFAGRK